MPVFADMAQTHQSIHMYIYIYIHVYVCIRMYTYACIISIHMYTYMYISKYIYIYIDIHICIYMYIHLPGPPATPSEINPSSAAYSPEAREQPVNRQAPTPGMRFQQSGLLLRNLN